MCNLKVVLFFFLMFVGCFVARDYVREHLRIRSDSVLPVTNKDMAIHSNVVRRRLNNVYCQVRGVKENLGRLIDRCIEKVEKLNKEAKEIEEEVKLTKQECVSISNTLESILGKDHNHLDVMPFGTIYASRSVFGLCRFAARSHNESYDMQCRLEEGGLQSLHHLDSPFIELKDKLVEEANDARSQQSSFARNSKTFAKRVNEAFVSNGNERRLLQAKAEALEKKLTEEEKQSEARLSENSNTLQGYFESALDNHDVPSQRRILLHLLRSFLDRTEESRESHSAYMLALATLAFEDAVDNGVPLETMISTLRIHFESVGNCHILNQLLSSVPIEILRTRPVTMSELIRELNALSHRVMLYSNIAPGGGGLVAPGHYSAISSTVKTKKADPGFGGCSLYPEPETESLLRKVEMLLKAGKLAEALQILEDGLKGTKAYEVISLWVSRARVRLRVEQALRQLRLYSR